MTIALAMAIGIAIGLSIGAWKNSALMGALRLEREISERSENQAAEIAELREEVEELREEWAELHDNIGWSRQERVVARLRQTT